MDGTDFDLADWAHLPPLDDADLPAEPPPQREHTGGITLGSDLATFTDTAPANPAEDGATDLGHAVHTELFAVVQPGLAELARLGSADFGALTAVQRVDALIAIDRQESWLAARKQELLALISTRDRSEQHWCAEEVGAALGLSGGVARTKLAHAEQLTTRLPATLHALSSATITSLKATAITEASFGLSDDLLPAFETRVLARAGNQSITGLKRSITRAVIALDPATAEQKHQRSLADRHVRITPAEHGMAWLIALLPAEDAHTLYDRLNDTARTIKDHHHSDIHNNRDAAAAGIGDGRSMNQVRADTLTTAVLHGLTALNNDLPTAQGRQPAISVIISLTTLTGQDNHPGWLDNHGPITADHARRIAHDPTGTWRRLITDPTTSQLLDYGTTRYTPPPHLTHHITTRDAQCTFPYCDRNARTSDLDHIAPFPHGPTTDTNLHPLHRRHHNAKTHAGWKPVRNHHTSTTHWTSPQNRHYQTQPPERWTTPEPPPF